MKAKKLEDKKETEASVERSDDEKISVWIHEDKKATPKSVEIEIDIHTNRAKSPGYFLDLSFLEDSGPENAQDL